MKRKILLFGDFGIDDTIALLYSFFNEEIEIVGIVADYGNAPREKVLRNINYLKYLSGNQDIPVFEGATCPLTGIEIVYYPEVHGPEGLGPIIPPTINYPIYPLYMVLGVVEKNLADLIIVNVGRVSSLAATFILGVKLMQEAKEYLLMGGAFFYPGNVTAVAEANFYGDPYAANIIINYAKNLTIIPLNVTQRAIITPNQVEQIDQFHQKTKDPIGLIIKPLLNYYYQFYSQSVPGIEGSPLHDVFPLWYLLNKGKVTLREMPIKMIVDRGDAFGQSIGDFRSRPTPGFVKHKVVLNFDEFQFKNDIMGAFLQVR
ncbi:nucleoside hydrolase [Paenibacillus sp. 102]|uniref:nucleoside hydrolase n=1 Tax=Paenibacillus sp. 102 TaxID=3120823 RepID=UPI0031BBA5DB